MRTWIGILLLGSTLAFAQTGGEIGATVGGGGFGAEDTGMPAYVTFGVEACGLCSRGVAIFGEYNHWRITGSKLRATRITSVNMVGVGVRLQGGKTVRPFFDVGFASGWDRFEYRSGSGSHGNPGLVLGGGVAKVFNNGLYIRPQVRMYVLRGIHAGLSASVGVGYRF